MWTIFQQKEKFAMHIITSTLVVLGLLFGGAATVSAAQDDLPTEPLYQLKLMSEDAKVWFTPDPVQKIEMLMEQAQTRTEEMAALTLAGVNPPAELTVRTQNRIQQALQLAAALDEPAMIAALEQIRTQLQTQEQLMLQLQNGTCAECQPVLLQMREMLQANLGQVETHIADPGTFRNQNRNQVQVTHTPLPAGSLVAPQTVDANPQSGDGQQNGNPNMFPGTPMPQNNHGGQNGGGQGTGGGPSSTPGG
jgi:hypothetical protein